LRYSPNDSGTSRSVADALLHRGREGLLDLAVLHEELLGAIAAAAELRDVAHHLVEALGLLGGEVALFLFGVPVELEQLRVEVRFLLSETSDIVPSHDRRPFVWCGSSDVSPRICRRRLLAAAAVCQSAPECCSVSLDGSSGCSRALEEAFGPFD
jgi:hypothetical protein